MELHPLHNLILFLPSSPDGSPRSAQCGLVHFASHILFANGIILGCWQAWMVGYATVFVLTPFDERHIH